MFDGEFYLSLVNGAFGTSISLADLRSAHSRIVRRIECHIATDPLPRSAKFNHYRPARYFSDNIRALAEKLSEQELDRFERAFKALNNLL